MFFHAKIVPKNCADFITNFCDCQAKIKINVGMIFALDAIFIPINVGMIFA